MRPDPRRLIERLDRARSARRWDRLTRQIGSMPLSRLRGVMDEARTLRGSLNRIIARGEARLDRVRPAAVPVDLPAGTDWGWRPSCLTGRITPAGAAAPVSGTRMGEETAVWHDCSHRALILRQVRNDRTADGSPFGITLETLGFSGSFLSVAIDLPPGARDGLTRSHIVRLATLVRVERPMKIYGRLNVGHGPNTDQLLRHLGDLATGRSQALVTEFDLHLTEMNERRLEKLWLDLIFEAPRMNAVWLGDLFLSRHLRAEV